MSKLRKLPKLGKYPRMGRRTSGVLPLSPEGPKLLDTDPEWFRDWVRRAGRENALKARRIADDGVIGTLPELIAYAHLKKNKRAFEFQSSLMGGRLVRGGSVADFLIFDLYPGGVVVWRVMGDYWHGTNLAQRVDEAQRVRLLGERYKGLPILAVVDLKESDIYARPRLVFRYAEAGVMV